MTIAAWREEPITKKHDRRAFDCGNHDLNDFLARFARQAHESGSSKTYVAVDAADGATIYGYYTLTPGEVDSARVPAAARPGGGGGFPVGCIRLAKLAVASTLQGQGLGGQLLVAAAERCMRASAEAGGSALLIDAKNDRVAAWYALYGAVPLNDAPLSLILPYATFMDALAKAGKQP
jgi:predicted N-acetyltransferase YhbS